MTIIEKIINHLLLGALFTLVNWMIVDALIIEVPFYKYFLIELILVISMKIYKFTLTKFKIEP